MHEKVKAFLKEEKISSEKRDQVLISWGLWEKEYAPEGMDVIPYPERDSDGRAWRKRAVSVTEEEWEQICRAIRHKRNDIWEELLKVLWFLCWAAAVLQLFDGALTGILLWTVLGALCGGIARGLNMLREMQ